MIKKAISISILFSLFFTCFCVMSAILSAVFDDEKLTTPERVIESIVIVNDSSGVVVYSDDKRSLVLTAKHVLREDYKTQYVMFISMSDFNGTIVKRIDKYNSVKVYEDPDLDLALIEIHPERRLFTSNITNKNCRVGDDIYLAANPNHVFRSLKKGIISSMERKFGNHILWEVSGGITFGSSGGGVFNDDGELLGVIISVLNTNYCSDIFEGGVFIKRECIRVPLSFIGFIMPPHDIRHFIKNSPYDKYFNYL